MPLIKNPVVLQKASRYTGGLWGGKTEGVSKQDRNTPAAVRAAKQGDKKMRQEKDESTASNKRRHKVKEMMKKKGCEGGIEFSVEQMLNQR